MATKAKNKGLKQAYLDYIAKLPEEEYLFLSQDLSREQALAMIKKYKDEEVAESIGFKCLNYLTRWPTEEKYDKAAKLLSLIPEDTPLGVYAFQYLRCCDGEWMPAGPDSDFDPEKFEEALRRYGVID